MSEYILVLCTVPDKDTGEHVAQSLLQKNLCACINIMPTINSIYWWQNKIEQTQEVMLFIKATTNNYKSLEQQIKSIHPYDNPEIIILNIDGGSSEYLSWIKHSIDK